MKTKNPEDIALARDSALSEINSIVLLAKTENRELTEEEVERSDELKAAVEGAGQQIKDHIERTKLSDEDMKALLDPKAVAIRRSDSDGPLDAQIERAARDIAGAVEEGRSIKRAITLPTGYSTGNAAAGDPTDVNDLVTLFSVQTVESPKAAAVRIDATVAGTVAEGAAKPDIVTATLVEEDVIKIGGRAEVTTEAAMYVPGTMRVIQEVLRDSILAGSNAKLITDLEAGGTALASTGDTLPTFLTAVATVLDKAPDAQAIVNVANWVGLTLDMASLPQNVSVPTLHVGGTTADKGIVAARTAVQVVRTPVMILVDPFTLAHENKTRIIAEQFLGVNVVRPTLVQIADLTASATP